MAKAVLAWLDRLDPGVHRRIKGLRLVTAFGIAWMANAMPGIAPRSPHWHLSWRHSGGFRPVGQRLRGPRNAGRIKPRPAVPRARRHGGSYDDHRAHRHATGHVLVSGKSPT